MEQDTKKLPLTGRDVFHICEQSGLTLDSGARKGLESFEILLREWNSRVNLISRKDVDNIWTNHILHSLTPLFLLSWPVGVRLLDIGTGGGLPGVPIAIGRPDISVCLADSIKKKTVALSEILQTLGIQNATVVNGRAEDISRNPTYRSTFDGIIARAVAPLPDLVKWSRPFLRKGVAFQGGRPDKRTLKPPFLIAMKGGEVAGEVTAAAKNLRDGKIETINIAFSGMSSTSLEEKKLIVIEFT